MRILIVFLIVSLLPIISFGQSQTDNWFFGSESGLEFRPTNVSISNGSSIENTIGCTAFSDVNRQVLFYSNGETVWNRNNEVMENGNNLSGETSNTQNSIIVPKPGSSSNYYLFTARRENSNSHVAGLKYSEIEISTTFPLGKVITKNAPLDIFYTEKITAVYSADGNTVYVIAFGTKNSENNEPFNTLSVYKVDATGVSRRETIEVSEASSPTSKGVMKASPDGKTIALAVYDFEDREGIYLFDFDRTNGAITYRRILSMNIGPGVWTVPYGLEFSQDSKILYYTGTLNSGNSSLLRQIPLEASGEPTNIFSSTSENYGSLQLASNGKIYMAKSFSDEDETNSNTVAVINFPNVLGIECDFQRADLNLTPLSVSRGLPNFIPNLFASKISGENQCYVDPFSFSAASYVNITNIDWDFGDGNSASGVNVNHTYSAPGNYVVEALLTLSNNTKTRIYKTVTAYELPVLTSNQELVECDDDADGSTIFNLFSIRSKITNPILDEELFFYLTLDDLNNDIQIPNPENFQNSSQNQEIFVKVVNENGCFETTSFFISAKFVPLNNISNFYTCEDSDGIIGNNIGQFNASDIETSIRVQLNIPSSTTLSFYRTRLDAQTNRNPLEDTFTSATSTLFVKGQEADLSCAGIQSFEVIVNAALTINLEELYTICFDPSLKPPVVVSANGTFNRFEWRDATGNILSTSQDFTLATIGNFSLTVYKSENGIECSNSKSFTVIYPEAPSFSDIIVNTEDETNNIVTINVNGNSNYEFSLDNINFFGNSTSYTFSNVEAGLQTVYVKDINNCEQPIQTNVSVIGFKKYFTPNGDGENDFWNIKGLDAANFKSVNVVIFDRFGKTVATITDFNTLGWDGSYNGKPLPENNYWFKSEIIDKNDNVMSESGNFSLLRN